MPPRWLLYPSVREPAYERPASADERWKPAAPDILIYRWAPVMDETRLRIGKI